MNNRRATSGNRNHGERQPQRLLTVALTVVLATLCLFWLSGCDWGSGDTSGGEVTTSEGDRGPESGNVEGRVGAEVKAGEAVVTVRALQATFQPAMPSQRLSEQTPAAPAPGESFYQAYVRVENLGASPIRVDPNDFACAVGSSVVLIEPTRSGPFPRSLLTNTSLDLLLTFKGQAGFVPVLIYSPPWYQGTIRISPELEETTETS